MSGWPSRSNGGEWRRVFACADPAAHRSTSTLSSGRRRSFARMAGGACGTRASSAWGRRAQASRSTCYVIKYAESSRRRGLGPPRYRLHRHGVARRVSIGRPSVLRRDGLYHMWFSYRGRRTTGSATRGPRTASAGRAATTWRASMCRRSGWDSESICYSHVFQWKDAALHAVLRQPLRPRRPRPCRRSGADPMSVIDRHDAVSPLLSIVAPVLRSDAIVPEFVRRTCEGASKVTDDFELLLVEDGSPDDSWSAIVNECDRDPRVKGVQLSRNFGQQPAITAGLAHARGRHVVVMDSDLQDDPDYIPALYRKALEGFDIVFARKMLRRFGFWRNLSDAFLLRAVSLARVGRLRRSHWRVLDHVAESGRCVPAVRRLSPRVRHRAQLARLPSHARGGRAPRASGRPQFVHGVATARSRAHDRPGVLGQAAAVVDLLAVWLFRRCPFCSESGWCVSYYTSNVGQMALGWTSLIISQSVPERACC